MFSAFSRLVWFTFIRWSVIVDFDVQEIYTNEIPTFHSMSIIIKFDVRVGTAVQILLQVLAKINYGQNYTVINIYQLLMVVIHWKSFCI